MAVHSGKNRQSSGAKQLNGQLVCCFSVFVCFYIMCLHAIILYQSITYFIFHVISLCWDFSIQEEE